jgi:hypothetical protein
VNRQVGHQYNLSKLTILANRQVGHQYNLSKPRYIGFFINDTGTTKGDSSKLQGDLNFAFDQQESEVNLHKTTSSP